MKETIQNSDLRLGFRCWENYAPHFSHFTVEFSAPLLSSENPIINKLLIFGFEVREAFTSFYFGFPTREYKLDGHFKTEERSEFQIRFDGGFLRFRFEGAEGAYLSLFSIDRECRGKGVARQHFPRIIDALFRAGVRSVRGRVAPSHYESADYLDIGRLIRFYVREAGFTHSENGEISKCSPYLKPERTTAQFSP